MKKTLAVVILLLLVVAIIVVMQYKKDKLPERVEKVRIVEEEFDLESADLTQIFKHRKKKSSKMAAKKEAKASDKNEEIK